MNFNSLQYLLFLPITLTLYFVLPKKIKNPMLLVASYFFYACWQPIYACLMLFSTAVTYLSGLLISKKVFGKRRLWLVLCFIVNLAILFFFKYFNFFSSSAAALLNLTCFSVEAPKLNVLLPVGISFYTFQALGYTADIYRGTVPAEKNFIDYALFVSFFPQLVAGPIERTGNILPQLKRNNKFSFLNLEKGTTLIIWGFFKKVLIADNAAVIVNTVYNAPKEHGALSLIFATVCFALQIYCDFSAYSDIAKGSAKIIGIELMQNFDCPYFAQSIKDFWRRWHISLSTWFKDYLYFPLGGSRKGTLRTLINLIIVFAVSGLWHGAALTFVLWGLLHGIYQVLGIIFMPVKQKLYSIVKKDSPSLVIIRTLGTFTLVCIGWIVFRANSVLDLVYIFKTIFTFAGITDITITTLGLSWKMTAVLFLSAAAMFITELLNRDGRVQKLISQKTIVRYISYFVIIVAILLFGYYGDGFDMQDFVYFQF